MEPQAGPFKHVVPTLASPGKKRNPRTLSLGERVMTINIYKFVRENWPKEEFESDTEIVNELLKYQMRDGKKCVEHVIKEKATLYKIDDPIDMTDDSFIINVTDSSDSGSIVNPNLIGILIAAVRHMSTENVTDTHHVVFRIALREDVGDGRRVAVQRSHQFHTDSML
ncbi:hypothetical protein EVAR_48048_1 [Eumeta japonica]|uniref:Uncharacterized protein n=1 Tax=Eumeta variegata TaxID=151549 RepID=A0A4C1XHQ7_EUMVA|nr:hypothetical protein EVAR_48048_1 [Eumeta japonica]